MQPQRREVLVENGEYKREQQRLAKQIKRMVVLRNDMQLSSENVDPQNEDPGPQLSNILGTLGSPISYDVKSKILLSMCKIIKL